MSLFPSGWSSSNEAFAVLTSPAQNFTAAASSFTMTAAAIGAASPRRHLFILVLANDTAAITISSVTAGGVAATLLRSSGNAEDEGDRVIAAVYGINVTSGTTSNIVVTFSAAVDGCQVYVLSCSGAKLTSLGLASYAIEAGTTTHTLTMSPAVVAGDIIIAGAADIDNLGGSTVSINSTDMPSTTNTSDGDAVYDYGHRTGVSAGQTIRVVHSPSGSDSAQAGVAVAIKPA